MGRDSYKRGRSQGANPYKKQSAFKRPRSSSSSASRARADAYDGIELKYLDTGFDGVSFVGSTSGASGELQPTSGCTGCISVPGQGDGESQRDGRKYCLKSAWFSGVISTTAFDDQPDAYSVAGHFVAMVLDTQANGTTVNSEDVFINTSDGNAFSMLPKPLRNLKNSKRFRILDSKYIPVIGAYSLTDGTNTGSINYQSMDVMNLSWNGSIECNSIGTANNISSASDNAIHIIGYASSTAWSPQVNGKCRVRFVG